MAHPERFFKDNTTSYMIHEKTLDIFYELEQAQRTIDDRATERAMIERATERPSERSSGWAIDGDRKSSSRSPFHTLTSALCSIFQN